MRFQLHIVHTGKVLDYQNKLLDIMEQKFDKTRVRAHKVEPHMTIKYGFECNKQQLNELIIKLDQSISIFKGAEYKTNGFDLHQDKNTFFLFTHIDPSENLLNAYKNFYKSLEELTWLTFESYDKPENLIFHSTLASGTKEEIEEIIKYIKNMDEVHTATVSKIVLYKFTQKINNIRQYKPYKVFNLNPE